MRLPVWTPTHTHFVTSFVGRGKTGVGRLPPIVEEKPALKTKT